MRIQGKHILLILVVVAIIYGIASHEAVKGIDTQKPNIPQSMCMSQSGAPMPIEEGCPKGREYFANIADVANTICCTLK